MKANKLALLGVPKGTCMGEAMQACAKASKGGAIKPEIIALVKNVMESPDAYSDDPVWGKFAVAYQNIEQHYDRLSGQAESAPHKIWGENLEADALAQLERACKLPVAVRGALMPDAHVGYGLPIGGVLAVDNAVIPYAVGVDIACRMKMTVLNLPVDTLDHDQDRLRNAIERETRFGVGATFKRKHTHEVMDRDWEVSSITRKIKDKAWAQLGTSGSGNHFVEFGTLTVENSDIGLERGTYLALLSHSGSRGSGAQVAKHFSDLARARHRELPKEYAHLSWLDLDSQEGQQYWHSMELMGAYAAANHELIHRFIARNLRVEVMLDIENHHNFAWKETHDGRDVIIHRKGATPAGNGMLGIIPGSMATPGFVVRGKGNEESLHSASHGAGRLMSRKAAKQRFNWHEANKLLADRGVTLISAGLDEVPMSYKNIETVMALQSDLVEPLARFDPRLVKMAPGGERPEG